jgi:hypothetical protein
MLRRTGAEEQGITLSLLLLVHRLGTAVDYRLILRRREP